ncbi:hypothetical protein HRbin30_01997 [bacterium HR30]|nr:hypothetical protein HRbin30_01997 [bacterium HR30]
MHWRITVAAGTVGHSSGALRRASLPWVGRMTREGASSRFVAALEPWNDKDGLEPSLLFPRAGLFFGSGPKAVAVAGVVFAGHRGLRARAVPGYGTSRVGLPFMPGAERKGTLRSYAVPSG